MNKEIFEYIIAALTLVSVIIALLLYILPLSQNQIVAIYIFDLIVVVILAADFIGRMKKSKQGVKFIVKNWYEIPAMLPLLLFTAIETQPFVGAAVRSLRFIRLFRLLRLLRLANLFRTVKYLKTSGFIYLLVISAAAVIFGAFGIYEVEKGNNGATIESYDDALWFAITTVTISGFGDVYPVTIEGKIIAGVLIFIGLAVLLGFISSFGATLITARLNPRLRIAEESRTLIKEKIDNLEKLEHDDIDTLTTMIRSLHDNLQKDSKTLCSCLQCGNICPNESSFCNKCGNAIR
jgi:voltage-gated potassium channel